MVRSLWQGAMDAYSEVIGASRGIVNMWKPDKIDGGEIFFHPHFVVVPFFDKVSN